MRVVKVIAALLLVTTASCVTPREASVPGLPQEHRVANDYVAVQSDTPIAETDPWMLELTDVRESVIESLELPEQSRPVSVYLFRDRTRYEEFLQQTHPDLPPRRAFFVGTPTELKVYAHWNGQIMEDLRHEYTHGVLHAATDDIPLWLDEGIAEYFEVAPSSNRINHDHLAGLSEALVNGWQPDLHRLSQLDSVSQMHRLDYQESWAWVHYLLHEVPGGRGLLVDYFAEATRPNGEPGDIAADIEALVPNAAVRMSAYVAGLTSTGSVSLSAE
jgi:hypothetical protein